MTSPAARPLSPGAVHTVIHFLGAVNVAVFLLYATLSYGLAPVLQFRHPQPNRLALGQQLAEAAAVLGNCAQAFLAGQTILVRNDVFFLACAIPLLAVSLIFVALLAQLARHRDDLEARTPRLLFRWAVAFAVVNLFAAPVVVQDFWLSIGWGRMVAAGLNPYYVPLTPDMIRGLPLDSLYYKMTYGPLWALIAGLGAWGTSYAVWLEAAFFKLFLFGTWVALLSLVGRLLRERPFWHQCVAISIVGWLPAGVMQTVAEGHNDVIMVVFMLLWLYWLDRTEGTVAPLALAASAATKYVTAPLFLLDVLHWRYARRRSLKEYLWRVLPAAVLLAVVFGIFFRSPRFFASTVSMGRWHFFEPADAVAQLVKLLYRLGAPSLVIRPLGALRRMVLLFFPALACYHILRYPRRPDQEHLWDAALAILAAMLFSAVGHLWPWFVLWAFAIGALVTGSALTRWVLGIALAAPFALLTLFVFRPDHPHLIPTLVLNGFALLWFVSVPRRWFPAPATGAVPDRQ